MILRRRRGNPEIFANLAGNAGARGGIFDKNVSAERYRISVFAAAENKARIDKIFRLGKITFFVKFAVIRSEDFGISARIFPPQIAAAQL